MPELTYDQKLASLALDGWERLGSAFIKTWPHDGRYVVYISWYLSEPTLMLRDQLFTGRVENRRHTLSAEILNHLFYLADEARTKYGHGT